MVQLSAARTVGRGRAWQCAVGACGGRAALWSGGRSSLARTMWGGMLGRRGSHEAARDRVRGQGKQTRWEAAGVKQSRLRLDMRGLGGIGRTRQVQVAVPATMRSGRRCAYDTAAQRQRRAIAVGRGVRIRTASGVERDGQAGEGYCWMDRMVQLSTTSSGRSRRAPAAAATSSEALTALEDRRKPPASNRRR